MVKRIEDEKPMNRNLAMDLVRATGLVSLKR